MSTAPFSLALATLVFLALAFSLLDSENRNQARAALVAAALLTAVWAAAGAVAATQSLPPWLQATVQPTVAPLEQLRNVAWLFYLLRLLRLAVPSANALWLVRHDRWLALGAAVALVAVDVAAARAVAAGTEAGAGAYLTRLLVALAGLALVENLSRNAPADRLWSIKFMCIGLAGFFAYNFFLYADALLFMQISPDLAEAHGIVVCLTAPLLGIGARRRIGKLPAFAISHRFAFHSVAILGGGIYLLAMAGAGYYLRTFGGAWGNMLTVLFLFGAALLLVIVVSSGQTRARLRIWILKNFFAYKYDYREEWLRFTNTLALEQSGTNLRLRTIRAVANLMDSPAGALWQWDDMAQRYAMTEAWNFSELDPADAPGPEVERFMARTGWIVNLAEAAQRPEAYAGLEFPAWLRQQAAAWLLVPLTHNDRLLGILLLHSARAPREVDWEDYDLLKMAGRQAASYLAEHAAMEALTTARQMEMFNKRFAFVVHDIKTTINNLSLLLANADKHGSNPEFQADLLDSVRESVTGMNRLLQQINAERKRERDISAVDLVAMTRRAIEQRKHGGASVILETEADRLYVAGDEARVASILGHLVQNAVEAAGEDGHVRVRLGRGGQYALLEVDDDGSGMEPEFIRDQLFRPFNSTKEAGYGIGAFQCRELVRELKGQMTVSSVPGEGTTMRVQLPVAAEPAAPLTTAAHSA